MRTFIKSTLVKSGGGSLDDGMDMTICSFDFEKMEIRYAIANQTALIIRGNDAIRLKGDAMPVGSYVREKEHFKTQVVGIEKGDMVYMFSDGLQDQLGGRDCRKFLLKNLTATLIEIHNDPMNEQRVALEQTIIAWRGGNPQIDDMTMVGIRV
jgi:serine phosphatase RsbU (regulator of sigma subunit)